MSLPSLQILSFNSSCLENLTQLKNTGTAFQHISKQHVSTIIACGSYANSYKELITLAHKASTLSRKKVALLLQEIIDNHSTALQKITTKKDAFFLESQKKITDIAHQISALLHGISLIKEISNRTITLLDTYGSDLATILIQANMYYTHNIQVAKIELENTKRKRTTQPSHSIIALPSQNHEKDHLITNLAITHKAQAINIWSHEGGVMSANPKIVARAFPIKILDYSIALEIGYLGGKILHPTAIQNLKKKKIPILLYSIDNPTSVASTVTEVVKNNQKSSIFSITERDKLSILTIKSTKMFDTYGYLETIFKVFSCFRIPVETLSSSEISITLTFPTKYNTPDFKKELAKFCETSMLNHQTIVSIIGKNIGTNTHILSKIFSTSDGYPIHMISLGQSGSSLHLVFDTKYKNKFIPKIYQALF